MTVEKKRKLRKNIRNVIKKRLREQIERTHTQTMGGFYDELARELTDLTTSIWDNCECDEPENGDWMPLGQCGDCGGVHHVDY